MSHLAEYVGQRIHFLRGPVLLSHGGRDGNLSVGEGRSYLPGDELTLTAADVLTTLDADGISWLDTASDFWEWGPAPESIKPDEREEASRVLFRATSGMKGAERLAATRAILFLRDGKQPW